MKHLFSVAILSAILCGCQTGSNVGTSINSAIKDPATVQIFITVAGTNLISKFTASDKAIVHRFATSLLALSVAQIDAATIDGLVPPSASSNQYVGTLISFSIVELNTYLKSFGAHNAEVVKYAQAVGNGLLSAGF